VFYQCVNVESCGAAFGGVVEITHRISAGISDNPHPGIVRTAPSRKHAANDTDPARTSGPEVPPAHNDQEGPGLTAG
jgi:hypothetical protein